MIHTCWMHWYKFNLWSLWWEQQSCSWGILNNFLNRWIPNMHIFICIHQILWEMEAVVPCNQESIAWQPAAVEECLLDLVQHSPHTNVCRISNQIIQSAWWLWQTIHDEALQQDDYDICVQFCQWIVSYCRILNCILFIYEAQFNKLEWAVAKGPFVVCW